jgi:demethylmenaquinone methyltransferase/2-methoxy-6-polyprenyl-1,4-benzoquinol methylase
MNQHVERFLDLVRTPPRSVRDAYDAVAHEYDEYEQAWLRVAGAAAMRRVETILIERLVHGARVLDAGTGTGAAATRVLATGRARRVVGVDLSMAMLRVAQQSLRNAPIDLIQADLMRLPLQADQFDAVVSTWVLETVPDPRLAVAQLLQVLAPEGFLACAFSSAATDPVGALQGQLLRRPLSEFAGRFLTDAERPMHWCARSSLERFNHGLTTVVVLGKCCTVDEFGPCLPRAASSAY